MGVYDSALIYYQKVLDYVLADMDSIKIAITIRNIGIVHHSQGRLVEARKWYLQSLEMGKVVSDTIMIVRCLTSLGALDSDLGNYVEAIKVGLEALTIAELLGSLSMQSDILANLGILYGKMGNYHKSLDYHLSSLQMDLQAGDQRGISYSLNNIGLVYKNLGMTDSAVFYYNQSLEIKRKLDDRYGITTGLSNLGAIYLKQGKLDKALACYDEALVIADSAGMLLEKITLLIGKADVLVEKRFFDQAKEHYFQSLQIAEKENLQEDIRDNYEGLAALYEKSGDLANTVKYLRLYSDIKDSLLSESSHRSIAEMQTRFETEKKEKEIEILSRDKEIQTLKIKRQSTQLYFLLALVLFTIIIAILIYSRFRLKQINIRSELEKKNLETEHRLLRSQMNPHFIFNSMNSIQSYISGNDNFTAMSYLSKFAKLMRFILENSRKSMISLSDEIETLELYMDLEKIRFKDMFDFNVKLSDEINTEATYVPPMLIQPFIENSIKHGFRNKNGKGNLIVNFQLENEILKCEIRDNGIGRKKAEEINKQKDPNHKSVGMEVTRQRLETFNPKEKGKYSIIIKDLLNEKGEAEGTDVFVKMPYEKE